MFYFYVLRRAGSKNNVYFGYTNDLKRRTVQHLNDDNTWKLIYYEAYASEKGARSRERKIKQYGGAWRSLKKQIYT